MRISFGLKAHSGWAALVALGKAEGGLRVIERRRIELVDDGDAASSRQPYHAAEGRDPDSARRIVQDGIEAARRIAVRQMQAAVDRARQSGHRVAGCAVLVAAAMPDWSTEQILAVHIRMHQAEGTLFADAIARAAAACGLRVLAVRESELGERARKALATPLSRVTSTVAELGRAVGPPWGKDQKSAALAAMLALEERPE